MTSFWVALGGCAVLAVVIALAVDIVDERRARRRRGL